MIQGGGVERTWPGRGLLARSPLPLLGVGILLSCGLIQVFSREKPTSPSRLAPYRWPLSSPLPLDLEIDAYQRRLKLNPGAALDRTLLAKAYLQKARRSGTKWFDAAEKEAQESLAQLPQGNPQAKLVLAQVHQARHEFDRSIALAQEARRERPGSVEALSVLIQGYLGRGRVAEAATLADELIFRFPSMSAYQTRGQVMTAWGREREAIYSLSRAIELEEPGDPEDSSRVRAFLGRLHLARGRLEPARDLLKEALRIDPQDSLAHGLLGDLELRERHFTEAETRYSAAFQISREAGYLVKKARAKRLLGNPEAARVLVSEAERILREELARNSYGHRRQLALLLLERRERGDSKEALALLEEETLLRRDGETLSALGRALGAEHRWKEAQSVVAEAIRSGAEDSGLYLAAAQIEHGLGNGRRERFFREAARSMDESALGEDRETP
jgi:tetratricopeptide (TPR) repeat protein